MVACYESVAQLFPEDEHHEKKEKYQKLGKLLKICERLQIDLETMDLMGFYDLRAELWKERHQV